jgi:hypothetical protein
MRKKEFWVNIVSLGVEFLDCFVDDAGKRFRKDLDFSSRQAIENVWDQWLAGQIPNMPDPATLHFDNTVWTNHSLFNSLKNRSEAFAQYIYARYLYMAAKASGDNSLLEQCIDNLKKCYRQIKEAAAFLYCRLIQRLLVDTSDINLKEELKQIILTTDFSDDEIFYIQPLKDKLSQGEIIKGNLLKDGQLWDGQQGRPKPLVDQETALASRIEKGNDWSCVLDAYHTKDWTLTYNLTKQFLAQYPDDARALAMLDELHRYRKWIQGYNEKR